MKKSVRWDNLTSPQIGELAKQEAIVLLPLGSTEQHGPHLPVGTDALLSTHLCELAAEELVRRGKPCIVAPTVAVANSMHHMHFAGSLSLSPRTYIQVLVDICRAIAAHGFHKIVMVNGHGGNDAPTNTALIEINRELGFPVYFTGYFTNVSGAPYLESRDHMIHACEGETSLILSLDETLVDPVYKQTSGYPGYPQPAEDCHDLSTFHYMEAHTKNGVMGDSYLATREKGDAWKAAMAQHMADVMQDDHIWTVPV